MKKILYFIPIILVLFSINVNAQCTDPDGEDEFTKGTTTAFGKIYYTDKCLFENTVVLEWVCNQSMSSLVSSMHIDCPNGCQDGACIECTPDCGKRNCGPAPNGCGGPDECGTCTKAYNCNVQGFCEGVPTEPAECTDPDMTEEYPYGKDFYNPSTVIDDSKEYTDYCKDSFVLHEYYCLPLGARMYVFTCPADYVCEDSAEGGACVTSTAPPLDCSTITKCENYNNFALECNTDFCKNNPDFPAWPGRVEEGVDGVDSLYPCYYLELDTKCYLCSEDNLGEEAECSDYDNEVTCTAFPCGGPCEWEEGVCEDKFDHSVGAQDPLGNPIICNFIFTKLSKCTNGVKTREVTFDTSTSTGTFDECKDKEPASQIPCLIVKKFPFYSPTSIIIALVLLIGYYIFKSKRRN